MSEPKFPDVRLARPTGESHEMIQSCAVAMQRAGVAFPDIVAFRNDAIGLWADESVMAHIERTVTVID